MCGLSGVASKKVDYTELNILCTLGILSGHRGDQGVGIIEYSREQTKGAKIVTHRSLSHPRDYFANSGVMYDVLYKPRWKKTQPNIVAAHTRFATQGAVKLENQHPFKHGSIIGMHNGTIRGDFSNREKFDTDSETLIHNIHTMGVTDALSELKNKDAAYAIVFVNTKEQTLNFIRNKERKLAMSKDEGAGTLFWSSDEKFLNCLWAYEKCIQYPQAFEEDALYSVPLESKNYCKDLKIVARIPEKKLYNIPEYNERSKSEVNFPQTNISPGNGKEANWKRSNSHGMWETFKGCWATFDIYKELIQKGCRGCGTVSYINDNVKFLDKDHYLCFDCRDDDVMEKLAIEDIAAEKEAKKEETEEQKFYKGMFQ